MSMTKKEKEEMERLLTISALRYTTIVEPDIDPPINFSDINQNGYLFNPYSMSITEACTSSMYHGLKHNKTNSQGSRSLYSTRLRAALAFRNAIEKEAAKKLRQVDIVIENELQKEKEGK